jgi:hypothetical protein
VTASKDGTARVWDAATGDPLSVPLEHERAVNRAEFSPDGTRVVTASEDGTARVWRISEMGSLDAWVQQATNCLAQPAAAASSSGACQLANRPGPNARARAHALVAVGDYEMHTSVWSIPRAHYRQALALLDPHDGRAPHQDTDLELHRSISTRLAIIAAMEGDLVQVRTLVQAPSPFTDARLLRDLGETAHDELYEDSVAVVLYERANEMDAHDPAVLADLAEAYFAAGQMESLAPAIARIDLRRMSPGQFTAIATLTWARDRLTHAPAGAAANHLLKVYRDAPTNVGIEWTWTGTKHALLYGQHRYEDVKPIIDVLTLLEQPVTDATREQLTRLLATPASPHPKLAQ